MGTRKKMHRGRCPAVISVYNVAKKINAIQNSQTIMRFSTLALIQIPE